jgi:hypothetical protein
MERWRRAVAILKASWAVLRGQPELMILPVVSALAVCLVAGGFLAAEVFWKAAPRPGPELTNPWFHATAFAVYLVCAFIVVFSNAALVYCAQRNLTGGRASLGEGVAAAFSRWPQILAWSVIAATVGLALKTLAAVARGSADNDKAGFLLSLLGIIVVSLLDTFWVAATFFVMPVLVIEGVGPFTAIKRSSQLIRQRWGEVLVGEGGLGIFAVIVALVVVCMVALLGGIADSVPGAVVATIGVATAAATVAATIALVTMGSIFVTGAYDYAVTGQPPVGFGPGLVEAAFKTEPPKKPTRGDKTASAG